MTRSVRICRLSLPAVLLLFVAGCAAAGSGGGNLEASYLRMDVGAATATDFVTESQDILRRQQFVVLRVEQPPALLVETEWRNQTPLEDEQALGITDVRCRILVRGRERAPSGSLRMHQATFTMEVQVRSGMGQEWQDLPMTRQRNRFGREIAEEIRLALEFKRRGLQ